MDRRKEIKSFKKTSVIVDSELDLEFKRIASRKYQFQKGWYSNALAEAMELWIKANEMIFLKNGVTPMTRFIGSKMWGYFNNDPGMNNDSKVEAMDTIFDFFNDNHSIKDVDYKYSDGKFTCNVAMNKDSIESDFERLVDTQIIPISMVARAGLEDITGSEYQINKIKVDDKKGKIELSKSSE
ncbi:hypothetical protein [Methanobacterium alcaliphilum]|uniref:hypothetical protein n=1 Tax=Methanobacterium alcaliphilum TaxID=392018 RepID=UPI00200B3064|nr:hypothetical protein [Methanobacterium alcaliphilum]